MARGDHLPAAGRLAFPAPGRGGADAAQGEGCGADHQAPEARGPEPPREPEGVAQSPCEPGDREAAESVLGTLKRIGYSVTLLDGSPAKVPDTVMAGEFHILARP